MVAILLADGFEEAEALVPCDILRRGGVETALVGVTGQTVTGSHGVTVLADLTLDALEEADLEMVVLPGGPGHKLLRDDPRVERLTRHAAEQGRWVAAICAAPTVLGGWGLLEGRRAVCFPGMEDGLSCGRVCRGEQVVTDGSRITGQAAGAAYAFGYELLERLKGAQVMEQVKHSMYYR